MSAVAASLAACGGGSDAPAELQPRESKIHGVAAIGSPIVGGNVQLKCANGASATATTDPKGEWSAQVQPEALPCALKVSGGQVDGAAFNPPLHSLAAELGLANITPLTDALLNIAFPDAVAQLFDNVGNADDSPLFKPIDQDAAIAQLQGVLQTLPGKPALPANFNPITTPFSAQRGDPGDELLESYRTALNTAGWDYQSAAAQLAKEPVLALNTFAGKAFTTPNMTPVSAYAVQKATHSVLISMQDPNRGLISAPGTLDDLGNVAGVEAPFTGVASLMGNKIAQYCVQGQGAFESNTPSQYVYIADDWEPVTDAKELYGKTFLDYENCANTGTVEFLDDDSVVFTQTDGEPDEPDFGFAQALAQGTPMIDEKNNSSTLVKAYKRNAGSKVVYAYIGVATTIGSNAAAIDGESNYVTMGISE